MIRIDPGPGVWSMWTTAKIAWRSIGPPKYTGSRTSLDGACSGKRLESELRASKTNGQMIVDHSHRLHSGVHNGRADETEAATFQVLANRVRYRRAGRHLSHAAPGILQRTPVDETPQIGVERAELPPDCEKGAGVSYRRFDLETVAH